VVPVDRLYGATLVQFSHRFVSTIVAVLVLSTALAAWQGYRDEPWIFWPALAGVGFFALQVALGGSVVWLKSEPVVVGFHLANALLLLGTLITVAVFAFRPWRYRIRLKPTNVSLFVLALSLLIGTFALILGGTVVSSTFAGFACPTWPLCNDEVLPAEGALPLIAVIHRYMAGAIGLFMLYTFAQFWRQYRNIAHLALPMIAAAVLFAAQIVVGAIDVLLGFPPETGALHLGLATALWSAMVVFALVAFQATQLEPRRAVGLTVP
jgi:heme A synthase